MMVACNTPRSHTQALVHRALPSQDLHRFERWPGTLVELAAGPKYIKYIDIIDSVKNQQLAASDSISIGIICIGSMHAACVF